MATSPNYGWSEPDNTSLVKDGAQAMRTLGDAIDASVWSVGQGQSGKNKIINGSMAVAQRGTSFSSSGYTLDRWISDSGTVVRDTGTAGIPFSIKITNTSVNPAIRQGIELPAAGNAGQFTTGSTWTVSYYAKRSTGTSSAAIYLAFNNGVQGGAPTQILLNSSLGTVTTTWQRFSATFTISATPSGSDNCIAVVPFVSSGAFSGDTWFTGVQLEQGSIATPFQTASGGSIQSELAMCQRYYVRWVSSDSTYTAFSVPTPATNGTTVYASIITPQPLRTKPSSVDYANLTLTAGDGVFTTVTSAATDQGFGNNVLIAVGVASGLTQYRPYRIQSNNNANAYLGLSAEL